MKSPAGFNAHLLDIGAPTTFRRASYSYSVIPGGAFNGSELKRAVNRDAVVAQHYSDVDPSTMRPEIVKADRLAYVSYRIGDRVYWTSKKVRIRSGETILTNGQKEIRARCGNCISMAPLMPTSADEPDAMQLDALTDNGPMQLEALNDTSPVLVAWPLNPLAPLAPGGPVGVEMGPVATIPQFGLPLFPFPSGFPAVPAAGAPGDTEIGRTISGPLPGAGPGVGVDTLLPGDVTLPGGVTPPAGGVTPPSGGVTPPPGGVTPPLGGVTPPVATGPTAPGFSVNQPLPFGGPGSLIEQPPAGVAPPPPVDATPVPEPATLLLLGGGIAGLIARGWRSIRS